MKTARSWQRLVTCLLAFSCSNSTSTATANPSSAAPSSIVVGAIPLEHARELPLLAPQRRSYGASASIGFLQTVPSLARFWATGMNVRQYAIYGSAAQQVNMLAQLRVYRVRGYGDFDNASDLTLVHSMMAAGVNFTYEVSACQSDSTITNAIKAEISSGWLSHMSAFEPDNEVDLNTKGICGYATWEDYVRAKGPHLYALLKSLSPATPVLGWSLAGNPNDFAAIGTFFSTIQDLPQFHSYNGWKNPGGAVNGDAGGGCYNEWLYGVERCFAAIEGQPNTGFVIGERGAGDQGTGAVPESV